MPQENKILPPPEEGKFGFIVSFPSTPAQPAAEPATTAVQPAAPTASEPTE